MVASVIGTPTTYDDAATSGITGFTMNLPSDAGTAVARRVLVVTNSTNSAGTTSPNMVAPAGWTLLATSQTTGTTWLDQTWSYQDFAAGVAIPATVTYTNTGQAATGTSAVAVVYQAFGAWGTPVTTVTANGVSTIPLAAYTATDVNSLVLAAVGLSSGSASLTATPTGYTIRAQATTSKDVQLVEKQGSGAAGSWTPSATVRATTVAVELLPSAGGTAYTQTPTDALGATDAATPVLTSPPAPGAWTWDYGVRIGG